MDSLTLTDEEGALLAGILRALPDDPLETFPARLRVTHKIERLLEASRKRKAFRARKADEERRRANLKG